MLEGGGAAQPMPVVRPQQENIIAFSEEESVDQLLEKLAKKGKRVKIINEEGSTVDDAGNT